MAVVCGNQKAHQGVIEYLRIDLATTARIHVHHANVEEVRRCFAAAGGIWTLEDQSFADEANAEAAVEACYERWLEDGGSHAEAIAAEDEIERRMEAMDVGLQMMRAARQADEDAYPEPSYRMGGPA